MQFHIWIGMGTIWLPNWLIFHSIICNRKSFQNFVNIWNNIYFCSWLLTNDWFPFNDCGQKSESNGNLGFGSAQLLLDWDRRARIQFGQVHFGVFSMSCFVVGPKWPSWHSLRKCSFFVNRHFSSLTGGSNWRFRCLDSFCSAHRVALNPRELGAPPKFPFSAKSPSLIFNVSRHVRWKAICSS